MYHLCPLAYWLHNVSRALVSWRIRVKTAEPAAAVPTDSPSLEVLVC